MRVEEFRDLVKAVNQMVTDYSACVGDDEKVKWLKRAERLRLEAWAAQCPRSGEDGLKAMVSAIARLGVIIDKTMPLANVPGTRPIQPKSGLYWSFDGSGEWEAESARNYEGFPFKWRIGVCDDGTFDVSESDTPLVVGKVQTFPNLEAAKAWCDDREDSTL